MKYKHLSYSDRQEMEKLYLQGWHMNDIAAKLGVSLATVYHERARGDTGKLNEQRIHPTQKPVALYDWIFQNYAAPGCRVLDTHLGSGSSRIAAYEAGVDFIGFEIDPIYYAAEEQRFLDYTSQTSLFHLT